MADDNFEELEEENEKRQQLKRKLNNIFSQYFNLLLVLEIILIFVFGYFLLLKPKYDQINNQINLVNNQEQRDYQSKVQELQQINSLIDVYKKIDPDYVKKINSLVPVEKNREELFSQINYIVAKNQLLLSQISLASANSLDKKTEKPATTTAKDYLASGEVEKVSISISVKGATYELLKNFLSALENNLRLMDVQAISFNPKDGSASLTVNTYYLKQ